MTPSRRSCQAEALSTIEDFGKGLDAFFADQAKFNAEMSSYDDALRIALSRGVTIRKTPDMPPAELALIEDRLAVFAKRDANTPIGAAAARNLAAWRAEAAQQSQQQSASTPAPSTGQPAPQAPAAEAPAVQPRPAPATPTASSPKPAEAKVTQVETAKQSPVEPQPAPAPPQRAVQPPNVYGRRTRVLTPEERSALTKTHFTSRPKPKDETPETMPAHAKRRRPALHDEPPNDDAPSSTPSATATSLPPTPSPAAQPTPEPDVSPAAAVTSKSTPPTAARAPEPEASRQPTTTTIKPAETETASATTNQAAEPPPIGPTVDIAALPEAKKRKKKKFSELTADERRRVFIAQQRTRGGR